MSDILSASTTVPDSLGDMSFHVDYFWVTNKVYVDEDMVLPEVELPVMMLLLFRIVHYARAN